MSHSFIGTTARRRGWKSLALSLSTGLTFLAGGAALAAEAPPESQYYAEKTLEMGSGWELKNVSGYAVDGDGRYYSQDVYNIKSTAPEAIYQVPLHSYLQEELAADAAASTDESVFVVDKKIAEEIALSYAQGELTPALQAIAEPLDGEVPTKEIQALGPFGSCSDQTYSKSKGFTLNTPISSTHNFGSGFSGTLSATGNINGSATGEVVLKIKRHKIFWVCVPYAVKFQHARAWGNVSVASGSAVNGNLNYNFSWQQQIAKPSLGSLDFFIGPVPVHIGFNLPINLGLDVSASVTGTIAYNGTQTATGSFDYTCTLSGCGGYANYNLGGSTPQPVTGSVTGRVYPTVWVQAAVRAYLYSESIAYAQVGVRPYLYGDLWGYYGNTCGDADGNGINETVSALTFNLDWRLFITAQASAFGGTPTQWNNLWSTSRRHLKFWDLISGGSSAIRPILGGPASTNVNTSTAYSAKMRSCWPYTDTVNYRFAWGDTSTTNISGAPQTAVSTSKAWSTSGAKTVQLTALSDSWGRQLNSTSSRSIQVNSTGTWTAWFNRDAPGGSGDYETLTDLISGGYPVCSNPTAVECQTTAGAPWNSTGEVYSCSLSGGVCVNTQQSDGMCQDYRVRFLCP